ASGTRAAPLHLEALEDRILPSVSPNLLKDIAPLPASRPSLAAEVNGTLFFSAEDALHGRELWRSDGTAAGTVLVKDILPGLAGSNPNNLMDVNGTLFFSADNGVSGTEL